MVAEEGLSDVADGTVYAVGGSFLRLMFQAVLLDLGW